MASAKPNPMQGCGRGIFGLKNLDALRKPKGRGLDIGGDQNVSRPGQFNQGPPNRSENCRPGGEAALSHSKESQKNSGNFVQNISKVNSKDVPKKGAQLKAGYSYSANPNSPLGNELSFTQHDSLKFMQVHETNPEWWLAVANGTLGYVPAKYMVSCEVTSLPWLQGRQEEIEEEKPTGTNVFGVPDKGTFKPYRSSYAHDELKVTPATSQWRCDICDKDFNGPKPYQAHMFSKAHKEEVEYQQGS